MQDHAKQGYTFGHLSLIRNLALDIPSRVATVRDHKSASQKQEIFGVFFRAPLFLGKWCGVTTYFLYKKIRKTKYKYMIELFLYH